MAPSMAVPYALGHGALPGLRLALQWHSNGLCTTWPSAGCARADKILALQCTCNPPCVIIGPCTPGCQAATAWWQQCSSTADCLSSQILVSEPLHLPGTLIHVIYVLHAGGRRQSLVATALRRGSLVGVPLGARRGSILLDGPNAVPAIQACLAMNELVLLCICCQHGA